jgi:ArsR family transcriptional regulator
MKNNELAVIQPTVNSPEQEEFALLARALGHPHRIAILRFLLRQDACFCGEIVDVLPVAQSTVSQHVKKLKQAGWIEGEIDGPRVCYCVKFDTLERFRSLLSKLFA